MKLKSQGRIDRPFLYTLLTIIGIGLLMVFSASMYSQTVNGSGGLSQFIKQVFFAVLGLGAMYFLSRINYKFFKNKKIVSWLYIFTIILLVAVLIPGIGRQVNGARRWLGFGSFTFQPSEIAKMVGIMLMASYVTRLPDCLEGPIGINKNFIDLLKCFALILLPCGLIAIEPSMSAAMTVGLGMCIVLYFAGIRLKVTWPFILVAGVGLFFLLTVGWRLDRIMAFMGQSTTTYQISQSLLAFGSGGWFGVGLGNGKQKLLFLPEIQNDFIFANIAEEFGLIGCVFVLFLYTYLIYRGFKIATACKDKFGYLYTASTMTLLGFQVFVNIAVATKTIPVTGMALPFISYGGTSIIILLATLGPVLNISRQVDLESRGRRKKANKNYEYSSRSRRDRRAYLSGNRNI